MTKHIGSALAVVTILICAGFLLLLPTLLTVALMKYIFIY